MKKKSMFMLVMAACVALTACGKEEEPVVTVPVDIIATLPADTVQPEEVLVTEPGEETPVEIPEAPTVSVDVEKEWVEMTPDEESIKFGPEYDGLYRIAGYMRASWGSSEDCSLDLCGVDVDNEGTLDAIAAKIPSFWVDYNESIYIQLTFKDENHIFGQVIDRMTMKTLSYMSEEQAREYFLPESTYDEQAAGKLPEIINLSQYEPGHVYVFDVETDEEGYFSIPEVTNDSTIYPLLAVSFKTHADEDFDDREYRVTDAQVTMTWNSYYSEEKKLYMAVVEIDPEWLSKTDECVLLSPFAIGEEVDTGLSDFVYNDTDKTFVIEISDSWADPKAVTVEPGEIAYVDWMNDTTVKDIIE